MICRKEVLIWPKVIAMNLKVMLIFINVYASQYIYTIIKVAMSEIFVI
jgi:hypothetical protein